MVTISVDAMGGDNAPHAVIDGLEISARKNPDISFVIHGPEHVLTPLLAERPNLQGRYRLEHASDVISMHDKPSHAVRRRESSMWRTLECVRSGEAQIAVSAGNTGALMAASLFCLRALEGVDRPAIAALWPRKGPVTGPKEYAVVLDMGADVRASARDLHTYSIMGAEYAHIGLSIPRPRVALLNVGVEAGKGRQEVRHTSSALESAPSERFDYVGFIEANDIPSGKADVIVTDGFTGNVALKSAEGTARLIGDWLKGAFAYSWGSRIGTLFAYTSMRRFRKRIDPRHVNGGVFLGLNGLVIKSHGGTDALGFSASVRLAARMGRENFISRVASEVAKSACSGKDAV